MWLEAIHENHPFKIIFFKRQKCQPTGIYSSITIAVRPSTKSRSLISITQNDTLLMKTYLFID